jgi:hypothetical protein
MEAAEAQFTTLLGQAETKAADPDDPTSAVELEKIRTLLHNLRETKQKHEKKLVDHHEELARLGQEEDRHEEAKAKAAEFREAMEEARAVRRASMQL